MGNIGIYYRFGEPTIGQLHSAFRSKNDLAVFLKTMGEKNLVDIFEIGGEIVEERVGVDGLYVLVEEYRKIAI
jgi:hypothetical protein